MLVTLSGMVMEVKPSQPAKARSPMLSPLVNTTVCRLSFGILPIAIVGIVTVTIFVHPEKAELPMLVTLSGIATDVKPVQP